MKTTKGKSRGWMIALLCAAASLVATTGMAQTYSTGSAVLPTRSVGGYGYGGYGYGGSYASTYEEGVLNGLARLRQAQGEYNLATAQANVYQQEAIAKAQQNRQQGIVNYFAARQINHEAREAERSPRLTNAQYAALARKVAPSRLTGQQYQPAIGSLNWPALLQVEGFAAERNYLSDQFAARGAGDSGAGSVFHSNVKSATRSMAAKLQTLVKEVGPMEYIAAKNFITSLEYEAQLAPIPVGIAQAE